MGGWAAAQEAPKKLKTNEPGQVAGEQVLILGTGFTPNEVVELDVKHADGTAEPGMGHAAFSVVAGADGAFVTSWVIRPDDAQGDQFQVTARGFTTGVITATASFDRTIEVGTDKFAYGPTESALITGTGFLPGEGVTLQVVHNDGEAEPHAGHDPWVVTADASGTINSSVPMNPSDTVGNEFILKASGGDSGLGGGAAIMDALACPPTPPPDTVVPTPLPSATCPPNLNSCTANDVVTTVVSANPIGNDVCATRGDTLTMQFTVKFDTTANQRYDLGIYVSEDGGTVTNGAGNTPPTARACGGLAPQVGDGDGNADTTDCDSDKFLDLDPDHHGGAIDTCGDLQDNAGPVFVTVTATVSCATVDSNLHLKVPSCRVWEQNAQHDGGCTGLAQAGTGSKCDCTDLDFTTVLNPCVTALCDDSNVCTADSCTVVNGAAVCHHDPVANGTSCDDNTVCNGHETCGSGVCQPGTPLNCDDSNLCTTDSCNPTSGCQHSNNTNPCSDGNACTTGDTCGNGSCQPGSGVVCNDNNVCTTDTCDPSTGCVYSPNTNPCDDGNPCTTGDVCGSGSCHGGSAPSCDDGNPCTTDTCSPASGCVHTNNTNPCDDGNACTTGDVCGGGSCHAGTAVVCNDNNGCTTDTCNTSTGCVYTNNTNPCDDGNACTTGDICGAGSCHAGAPVVCNDNNVCTTDTCNPSTGCVYTNNTSPCDDGNACTTGDTCLNGSCHGGDPLNCDDGQFCTDDACDPGSGCTHGPHDCGPLHCDENHDRCSECRDDNDCSNGEHCDNDGNCVECTNDNQCPGGQFCNNETCVQCLTDANCDDGNACTDDHCVANSCTHTNNTDPCNDGNACTTNDHCLDGSCAGGPPLNCDDGQFCTDDACDPDTGCTHGPHHCAEGELCDENHDRCSHCITDNDCPGGDHCDQDGNCVECTNDSQCPGGFCHNETCVQCLVDGDCNDNNLCTTDACVANSCTHTNNTAPCNDGNACTTGDTCGGGSCQPGTPVVCNDNNVCTTDTCNPSTGCVYTNNTSPCDDGNACTTNDHCLDGSCAGGPPPNCDDGQFCTDDVCNPATGCTHPEHHCDGGLLCDEDHDRCSHCRGDSDCDNGDHCDHDGNCVECTDDSQCPSGHCFNETCVQCVTDGDCNDNNECTDDACVANSCTHTNNNDPCNDGNACTTNDACLDGSCHGGPPPDCDDHQFCTDDVCDPATGCTHPAHHCDGGLLCDEDHDRCSHCRGDSDCPGGDHCDQDGNCVECTNDSQCPGGFCNNETCVQCLTDANCNDGNGCTDDHCVANSCTHTNNNAPCNDGSACTTGDTCGGGSCQPGTPVVCNDNNVCTTDTCNPASGCVFTNNTSSCDDGNACTTGDHCGGGSCQPGTPLVCNDGNVCTTDTCNPASGCVYTNNSNSCNDNNACTTNDHCAGGSCAGGPPPNCDDGNVCTTDACNPASGCTHTNNTAPCNDGNACTTNDVCGGGTCHGGSAPNCNDGNPCTTDSCNSSTGCVHTGTDGSDNSCSQVTDTMFCALPTNLCGTSSTAPQFRLIDLQNPEFSSSQNKTVMNDYLINASNPGQFYYNVFYAGTPGSAVNLTIEVSYPFITQGANPIQVHDGVTLSGGCYNPSPSLSGFAITTDGGQSSAGNAIIGISDYSAQQLGTTTAVHVNGTVPASGLVYVTIHLDYGLEKVGRWQQALDGKTAQGPDTNLDNVLDGLGDGPIYIQSPQPYGFDFSGGGPTHTYTPSSCNTFKKNSGVNGNTTKLSTGNPVSGVRVQFFDPRGVLIATTTTDADGFYNFTYKAKGKTASYTVKLPDYNKTKTVTLKANGYSRADFEDLP